MKKGEKRGVEGDTKRKKKDSNVEVKQKGDGDNEDQKEERRKGVEEGKEGVVNCLLSTTCVMSY